ncbi:MAG: aspartate kinase [candidate division Zixibacteria bacterium]|nr:aspartate kinase [candidate division Zixibacteria bacterium]
MSQIVVKLGGSILKEPEDIGPIITVLKKYCHPIIVVVSAFYGTTDQLIRAFDDENKTEESIEQTVKSIRHRATKFIDFCELNPDVRTDLVCKLNELLFQLHSLLIGSENRDEALTYGERISALILATIFQSQRININLALPEEIGLTTHGVNGSARVDLNKTRILIRAIVLPTGSYVIPGFYGVSDTGRIILLGRGGTDYSASAIASCVGALSVDLWKDVDGIRSTDPKCGELTQGVSRVSFCEAEELSSFGTKIIHPLTVAPLIEKNIPVRIFNIKSARVDLPMTIIQDVEAGEGNIKSISADDTLGIVTLSGTGLGMNPGILSKVIDALDKNELEIKSLMTSQSRINILLSRQDCGLAIESLRILSLPGISSINTDDNIAVVAMVGEQCGEDNDVAGIALSALAKNGVKARFCFVGSEAVASYIVVRRDELERTVKAIHRGFFPELPRINKRPMPTRFRIG